MIENISYNDQLHALIIRSSFYKTGIEFFTPGDFSQQLGYMNRAAGYIINPHVHKRVERKVSSNNYTGIKETHKMRYIFIPEIKLIIENKFKILSVNEWLTHKQPGLNTWNAVFVLQKI